jgi:enoyl-CoA hydratase/carnithine racemase
MTAEGSAPPDPALVDTEEDGKIYVITLNRPERMNAIGGGIRNALHDAFVRFRDDPVSDVPIVTGVGGPNRGNRARRNRGAYAP